MEEINRSRKLFHSLIENNNNIFLLVDDKLNILFGILQLESIAGWPAECVRKNTRT